MSEPIKNNVELHLKPSGMDCSLIVDGNDISNKVYKVEITAEVDKPTKVIVHMHMLDVTALGDTHIVYVANPRKPIEIDRAENELGANQ